MCNFVDVVVLSETVFIMVKWSTVTRSTNTIINHNFTMQKKKKENILQSWQTTEFCSRKLLCNIYIVWFYSCDHFWCVTDSLLVKGNRSSNRSDWCLTLMLFWRDRRKKEYLDKAGFYSFLHLLRLHLVFFDVKKPPAILFRKRHRRSFSKMSKVLRCT